MRRSTALLGVLAFLAVGFAGCAEEGVTSSTIRKKIAVKDVPAPVVEAARKAMSDCEIEDAFENRENGKTLQSYEIRGRNKRGKIREARVGLDGKILEME
jgi:hypothetical protein